MHNNYLNTFNIRVRTDISSMSPENVLEAYIDWCHKYEINQKTYTPMAKEYVLTEKKALYEKLLIQFGNDKNIDEAIMMFHLSK